MNMFYDMFYDAQQLYDVTHGTTHTHLPKQELLHRRNLRVREVGAPHQPLQEDSKFEDASVLGRRHAPPHF